MEEGENRRVCCTCGALIVEYTFSFNRGLLAFLQKLYDANAPSKTDELGLTYSQRTNSQKLRYWGLAQPVLNEESRIKKGWWEITDLGRNFIDGIDPIRKRVVMCRNRLVRFEGELIYPRDVDIAWKFHADYAEQASAQIKFDNQGQGAFVL